MKSHFISTKSAGLVLLVSALILPASAASLSFINYTTSNGLVNNVVNRVYVSGSNIYAGTSGGLSISSNGGSSWTNYTTANGLAVNNVRGIYAS